MSSLFSWLPVALPADSTRIRVHDDADLTATLISAGAQVVDVDPDVEISTDLGALRHDARTAILDLGENQPDGGSRGQRALRRARASAKVRTDARAAARALSREGYVAIETVLWDYDQPIQLPGRATQSRSLVERLPERCIVVAHREHAGPTLLDSVVTDVAASVGQPVHYLWPLTRAGVLVTLTAEHVLRVTVGPARERLMAQRDILEALTQGPQELVDLLPWPMQVGRTGLAAWSAERRVVGSHIDADPSPAFLDQCLEFLVMLHGVGGGAAQRSVSETARRCGEVCTRERDRYTLAALGDSLDEVLADVPRGFAHGDFWHENLLCDGDRLVGVIDWDGAGPGRLPLLDLIHFQASRVQAGGHMSLGAGVVQGPLVTARAGGDEITREYCRRIGLEADPRILEALVLAFLIDRTALELELRPDLITSTWVDENVMLVLRELRHEQRGFRRPAP